MKTFVCFMYINDIEKNRMVKIELESELSATIMCDNMFNAQRQAEALIYELFKRFEEGNCNIVDSKQTT